MIYYLCLHRPDYLSKFAISSLLMMLQENKYSYNHVSNYSKVVSINCT